MAAIGKIAAIARLAATCCRFVEVEKGHDGLFQQAVSSTTSLAYNCNSVNGGERLNKRRRRLLVSGVRVEDCKTAVSSCFACGEPKTTGG